MEETINEKDKNINVTNNVCFAPTALMPLVSCGQTQALEITCDSTSATYENGIAKFDFTLNQNVQHDDITITVTNSVATLRSYDIFDKKLNVYLDITVNTVETILIKLNIKKGTSFSKDFLLAISQVPVARYTATFTAGEHGTLTGETTVEVDKGTLASSILPTYTAENGYTLEGWFVNGEEISTSYAITSSVTIEARFIKFEQEASFTATGDTITKYNGSNSEVFIPTTINGTKITKIGSSAFSGNKNVTKIVLPEGCYEIASAAFAPCSNLTKVVLNKNLRKIVSLAFNGCEKLSSVVSYKNTDIWTKYDTNDQITDQYEIKSTSLATILQNLTEGYLYYSPFTNDTWANVISYANNGGTTKMHEVYGVSSLVGLERVIHYNGVAYRARVIGENHDKTVDSKQASLSFDLANCLDVQSNWKDNQYSKETDYDGYLKSNMWTLVKPDGQLETRLKKDEPELFDGIKIIKKQTIVLNKDTLNYNAQSYTTRLFLMSYTEFLGKNQYDIPTGKYYEYWSNHTNAVDRIKKLASGTKEAACYFLSDGRQGYGWTGKQLDRPNFINKFGYKDTEMMWGDGKYNISFGFCI